MITSPQSEFGRLSRVMLKHPRDAFVSDARIASQWAALHYPAPPDLARALVEYDRFVDLVTSTGAQVEWLTRDDTTTLDSIYVRDASIVCDRGVVLCEMGKAARRGEPSAQARGLSTVTDCVAAGRIEPPGSLEGGDVVWLNRRTIAVGEGYRTNAAGIAQLRGILGDAVDQVIAVPLPHWRGEQDVMHLMSLISPVDADLAVVYAPLLPVPFRRLLLERGMTLVEVPLEEFDTMGTNVLAIAPRVCVMVAGNPRTRAALERAGARVHEYEGTEISVKGAGGPTCLTRPLAREL